MPLLLGKIGAYLTGFLIVVIVGQGALIYSYRDEIKEMATDIILKDFNIITLEDAIIKYNHVVESNKVDTEKKNKAYEKSQKPEIVVKYINKYITSKDSNATKCENINDTLANVNYFGL